MVELPAADEPKAPFGRTRHPFFMYDMMRRQEVAVRATVAAVRDLGSSLPAPTGAGRLLFSGMGTSFHAALATAFAAGPLLDYRIPAEARCAFDVAAEPDRLQGVEAALLFSAGGETAFTIAAQHLLKERKVPTTLITGTPESSSRSLADHALETRYAQESSWTHTVSYTTAVAAGISLVFGWNGGEAFEEEVLGDAVRAALATESRILELVEEFEGRDRYVLLGSGSAEATAHEGALKLREAAHLFATAVGVEEFLHGVLPSVDEHSVVLAAATTDLERRRAEQALDAARRAGAKALLVDSTGAEADGGRIALPPQPPWLAPISQVVPVQLLAYWTAVSNGFNPDVMALDDPRQLEARRSFGI